MKLSNNKHPASRLCSYSNIDTVHLAPRCNLRAGARTKRRASCAASAVIVSH